MSDEDERRSREPGSLSGDRARGILNHLLSDLPGVVYRCRNDRDWTMLGLTRNVKELTGYEPSELVRNERVPYADLIHPEDRERIWKEVQQAVDRQDSFRLVYRIETRSGEERWVLEQGRAVEEDGEIVLTGYIQDVSGPFGRRLAQSQEEMESLERQAEHLSLLQKVTAIANEERRLGGALERAIPEVCRSLGFSVGHAFLAAEDEGDGIRSSAIWHLDPETEGLEAFRIATEDRSWSREEGLPGRVLEKGTAEWVERVAEDPDFFRVGGDHSSPVSSGLAVPLMSGERALAVLEFYTVEPKGPDSGIVALLEQIGVQLGRVWERERAERDLRTSDRRFRQLAENLDAMFWLSTPEGKPIYASPGYHELTGLDEVIEDWREYLDLIHPEDRHRMEEIFSDRERAPYEEEYRIVRPDGEVRWIRQRAFPIENEEGEVVRVGGLASDITELSRARERLERILDALAEGVVILDRNGRITYANETATHLTPFSRPELLGRGYDSSEWEITHRSGQPMDPEDLPAARVLETGKPVWNEQIVVHGFEEGRSAVLSVNAVPFRAGREGREAVDEVIVSFADVTERERAAKRLRESEARFRQLAEKIDSVFWISSPDKEEMEYVSPAYRTVMGHPPEELYEEATRWLDHVHPDDRDRIRRALPRQARGTYDEEYRIVRPDGEVRWLWERAFPIRDEEGEVYRLLGITEDITERKRAEEDLRRAEEHFRAMIENSADVIGILDENLVTRYVSPTVVEVLGYTPREITGTSGAPRVHPEDRDQAIAELRSLLERPGETLVQTHRMLAKDGSVRYVESRARNLLHVSAVGGVVVNLRDITDRKELESQLRQAQKMEAVGRLAGGIAHDFNNLLTVIRSQSDLLRMDLASSSSLVEEVEVIQRASDRAARLTSQLLAFSREQMLRPRIVDLNGILSDMEELLDRVLGETINVETEYARDLPPIRVDSGQIEQVVLNLAVNARDAMPEGGTVRLSTEVEELDREEVGERPGLEPGSYVCLEVSDTGVGMDEEARARVFEPFFTTKEGAEGTGLGLAVSYGIVKQSGGTIHVDSEPGEGATFTVRFPPAEGAPGEPPLEEESSARRRFGESEMTGRLLVVEDAPDVRRIARRILDDAGFDVRTAADAENGLEILEEEGGEFDLLLTDVVLPGMSGWELVDEVRDRFPEVRLVVMSGYAQGPASEDRPGEIPFIQKPFSPEVLLDVIREELS
ncbi:MAG: PAS domain-containing protein [Thermoanaerobaculia bacterium]|nr:PAS domain-containing protein [Thermoanaerobaculia bacterium]